MKKRYFPISMKAITIVELTVALALFAVIGLVAFTFILGFSDFSKSNGNGAACVKEQVVFRKLVDRWFSALDSDKYTIVIGETMQAGRDNGTLVSAIGLNGMPVTYVVDYQKQGDVLLLQFVYPDYETGQPMQESLSCSCIDTIQLFRFQSGDALDLMNGQNDSFSFTIQTRVKPALYRCDIVFY